MRLSVLAIIIGLLTCAFTHTVSADPPEGLPDSLLFSGGGDDLPEISELDWVDSAGFGPLNGEYIATNSVGEFVNFYTSDGTDWTLGGYFYSHALEEGVDIVGSATLVDDYGDFENWVIYFVSDNDGSPIQLNELGW